MLRILGSRSPLSRRQALQAGGVLGLSLAGLSQLREVQSAPSATRLPGFGKAKACILLYLYGAPSQLEFFDLKPDAPDDVRSQFKPIDTNVPGVRICEHLPRTSRVMHHATLLRSLTSPYNIHNAAWVLSGLPKTDIPMELNPRDTRHWPFIGSVLDYLDRSSKKRRQVPVNVALPWKFSSRSEPFRRGGPYGGFLGAGYDPVCAEFHGKATNGDPYRGIEPRARFQVGQPGTASITLDRLDKRRSLLQQLESARRQTTRTDGFDRHQKLALELMTSSKLGRALEIEREPMTVRERYGMTLFGQSTLAARRLVENGVKLVTVFWDEFKDANTAWDTHVRQIPRLKDELLPGFDAAYSALIGDLQSRGLLEDTLVVVMSEHGRTPKLNKTPGGGREHWSGAWSALLAGGGIKAGSVYGSTDRTAAFPKDNPVSPKDMLATMYHVLGVDPATHIHDRENRPVALVPDGKVLAALLG